MELRYVIARGQVLMARDRIAKYVTYEQRTILKSCAGRIVSGLPFSAPCFILDVPGIDYFNSWYISASFFSTSSMLGLSSGLRLSI